MTSLFLSVRLSVCAPFRPYNSKTKTPIKLKFGGQIFHGVQTEKKGESFSYL